MTDSRACDILVLLFVLLGGCARIAAAQDSVCSAGLNEDVEEESLELMDDEEAAATMADALGRLRESPIDLNSAERDELQLIPGVTSEEADAIVRYREQEGAFTSLNDVRRIPGGDRLLARLHPYVCVQSPDPSSRARNPDITLSARLGNFFPGILVSDSAMLGAPAKFVSRLGIRLGRWVKVGMLMKKDAGERIRDGFFSGFVSYQGRGVLRHVILGDFTAEAGQGLVLWRGMTMGKNGDLVGGVRKPAARVLPYSSADEAHLFRGAAISLGGDRWSVPVRWFLFMSRTSSGAHINDEGEATSWYTSGLYQTAEELEKKNAVHELLTGTHMEIALGRKGTVGLTYCSSSFDRFIQPASSYGFSGETAGVCGGDFTYRLSQATAFGEFARTSNGGTAWVLGGVITADSTFTVSIAARNYSDDFDNIHANGYGTQTNTTNERGLTVGWSVQLAPWLMIRGYADQFKIPASTYVSLLPRSGSELFFEVTSMPMLAARIALAMRMRTDETMQPTQVAMPAPARVQADRSRASARFTSCIAIAPRLEAKLRVERLLYRLSGSGRVESGTLASQTLCYTDEAMDLECGAAFFEADSYNVRLYDYEQNLRGVVASPALFPGGSRWHVLVTWEGVRWARFAAKYAVTLFEKGPVAREFAVQAEVRL
jgi:hypothetical protein